MTYGLESVACDLRLVRPFSY